MNEIEKTWLKDDILKIVCSYFTNTQTCLQLRDEIMEAVEKRLPKNRHEDDLK